MADATSTFTVRGKADVDDAVRGLNKVGESAKDSGDKAETFGQKVRTAAAGLITAEAAMAAFTRATEFATDAVRSAIEADENLTAAAGQVSGAMNGFSASLGDIIIGGENGATAMLNLADILMDLTDVLGGAGEEGGIALMAVDALRDGMIGLTYVADGTVLVWESLKLLIEGSVAILYAAGQGVVGISTALADLAQVIVGGAIEAFAGLLEGTVNLAESLGAGGLLPEGTRASIESMRQLGQSIGEGMDPMARLNETGVAISGTFDQLAESGEQARARVWGFMGGSEDLRQSLNSTRTEIDLGTTSTRAYAGAVRDAQDAVAGWEFTEEDAAGLKLGGGAAFIDPKAQEGILSQKIMEDAAAAEAAAIEAKGKIAAALQPADGEGFGLGALLRKDYDAAQEAFGAIGGAAEGLGGALSSGLGAALSSQEKFGKAFKAALGQSLVSLGVSELLTGLSNLIPFGPNFNPVAGAARIALGGTLLATGKAMGGKGESAGSGGGGGGGGGRSVGESSGLTPMAQPQRQGPTNLIDYTGVTIVTNDTDSMRTLIDRQSRTAATGGTSRV